MSAKPSGRSAIAIALLALAAVPGVALGESQENLWFWFSSCGDRLLTLEMQLDAEVLLRASFPVCHAPRSSPSSQGQNGRLEHWFRPPRPIVWRGYQDDPVESPANELLEVNVWQAGADPTALTLGISIMNGQQIYMNTVHIADPLVPCESTVAEGLVVRTYSTEPESRSGS